MKDVTVNKDQLLDALRKNRSNHQKIFDEALEGWRKEAITVLGDAVAKAKAGAKFQTYINLPRPKNQIPDYDRAIKMLEMSIDSQITVSAQDFEAFVLDRWNWQKTFLQHSNKFSETAASYMAQHGEGDEE
jgi:hypothetical protein